MAQAFALPRNDGDVTNYDVPAYELFFHRQGETGEARSLPKRRAARTHDCRVIYINGQAGNPLKHAQQARATAAVAGGQVTGIYNAGAEIAGVVQDTAQSMSDKWTSSTLMDARAWVNRTLWGEADAKQSLVNHLDGVFVGNQATVALFLELCKEPKRETRIVCHSQGNIITCNALNALVALHGKAAIANKRVYAIASPVYDWGANKNIVRNYAFANDPITKLGRQSPEANLGTQFSGQKAVTRAGDKSEMVIGYERAKGLGLVVEYFVHSYYIYLAHLWDELGAEFP